MFKQHKFWAGRDGHLGADVPDYRHGYDASGET